MAEITVDEAPGVEAGRKVTSMRTVVAASCAGTAFEWYDFFIFGSLLQVISKNFFAGLGDTASWIASLALFGVGFAFRPIGALIFGQLGDRVGRKAAFLITVTMMGGGTFAIGLLPTYAQIGWIAPALLITLRIIQGTALGGQYGGAAIYVAEHAPPGRRGYHTGWVQGSAAFGLIGALAVIFAVRSAMGEAAFGSFGWRIPFFVSVGLLAISIWMRTRLSESPAFQKMKEEETASRAPFTEAFGRWPNLKLVLTAFFGLMCAQGAYWYTVFFYSEVFLEKFLKVDGAFANLMIMITAAVTAPTYVLFAWASDKVGRKPVMWAGMTLGLLTLFPGYHLISQAANPALVAAQARTPVVVMADPADCSVQFDPIGKARYVTACDIAKSSLTNMGVSYRTEAAPAGSGASVQIGSASVASISAARLTPAAQAAAKAKVQAGLKAALDAGGYPAKADPKAINVPLLLAVLIGFGLCATALYGPMAAGLTELFPTSVRYTALSLPYHLGTGWIGGFQPVTAFALVVATGNLYAGLWYTAVFTAISVACALFLLPETRGKPLPA